MRVTGALAATASVLIACPAWAQTAPIQPPPAETTVDDVVVNGGTLEQQARSFVEEVVRTPRGRGLARWMGPVCIGVVNFQRDTARVIADTIAMTAGDMGVSIAEPPCTPNLYIVGSDDGRAFAQTWVNQRREDFRWAVSGSHDTSRALERFETSDDPVRWWHISIPMYFDVFTGSAAPAVRLPGQPAPRIMVYAKSQIMAHKRDDLVRTVVIVDVGRAERLTVRQLCDYLVMVGFAQVDPDADMAGYSTILNVFDDPAAVQGLTDWDRAYLSALYAADTTVRRNPGEQARSLAVALRNEASTAVPE